MYQTFPTITRPLNCPTCNRSDFKIFTKSSDYGGVVSNVWAVELVCTHCVSQDLLNPCRLSISFEYELKTGVKIQPMSGPAEGILENAP